MDIDWKSKQQEALRLPSRRCYRSAARKRRSGGGETTIDRAEGNPKSLRTLVGLGIATW
jgi:hypothetical protein